METPKSFQLLGHTYKIRLVKKVDSQSDFVSIDISDLQSGTYSITVKVKNRVIIKKA